MAIYYIRKDGKIASYNDKVPYYRRRNINNFLPNFTSNTSNPPFNMWQENLLSGNPENVYKAFNHNTLDYWEYPFARYQGIHINFGAIYRVWKFEITYQLTGSTNPCYIRCDGIRCYNSDGQFKVIPVTNGNWNTYTEYVDFETAQMGWRNTGSPATWSSVRAKDIKIFTH